MNDFFEWIKLHISEPLAGGAVVISLLVWWSQWRWQRRNSGLSERTTIATEQAAEAAIRSANAAEKAAALSESPMLTRASESTSTGAREAPKKQDVRWKIEHVRDALWMLRNVGSVTATGVTADESAFDGVARQLPNDAAVRPGASVEFLLIEVWGSTMPHELWLTWDGEDEPVAVPIPPASHR